MESATITKTEAATQMIKPVWMTRTRNSYGGSSSPAYVSLAVRHGQSGLVARQVKTHAGLAGDASHARGEMVAQRCENDYLIPIDLTTEK